MVEITLQCCTCGEKLPVVVSSEPRFGFELYEIAGNAGWKPALDMNYGRTLVFCGDDCLKKQLTKGGLFRKRLISSQKHDSEHIGVNCNI